MLGWLAPECDAQIPLMPVAGTATVRNYYETLHHTLVLRLTADGDADSEEVFALCVGCTLIPSATVSRFRELSCRRGNQETLVISDTEDESLVVCGAVRLFDESSLRAWLGENARVSAFARP